MDKDYRRQLTSGRSILVISGFRSIMLAVSVRKLLCYSRILCRSKVSRAKLDW